MATYASPAGLLTLEIDCGGWVGSEGDLFREAGPPQGLHGRPRRLLPRLAKVLRVVGVALVAAVGCRRT
jgi:hypothetical protein